MSRAVTSHTLHSAPGVLLGLRVLASMERPTPDSSPHLPKVTEWSAGPPTFPSGLGGHQWDPGLVPRYDSISQEGGSFALVGGGVTSLGLLTFEQGADVPDVDAAGLHELAQRDLQEENGDSSNQSDQDIRDKEYTWGREAQGGHSHRAAPEPLVGPWGGQGGANSGPHPGPIITSHWVNQCRGGH